MPRGTGTRFSGEETEIQETLPEAVEPVKEELPGKAPLKELIRVRGVSTDGRVALWEKDKRHPGGQAWVCNDGKTFDVFPTAEVLRKIKTGELLRVNWNS